MEGEGAERGKRRGDRRDVAQVKWRGADGR
jgi:hypothetical protein